MNFIICLLLAIYMSDIASAKSVEYGSELETITVAFGKTTIFRFNDEVKTISQATNFEIVPADQKEPNYAVLAVTPRLSEASAKVSFILASGAIINTKIVVVNTKTPESIDSMYDFTPKENKIEKEQTPDGMGVSDLDLMKSMIRGDQILGYKSKKIAKVIKTAEKGLSANLVWVYTGPKFNGYIFEIKNATKKTFAIDIKSLDFGSPNTALLSQVDLHILAPKDSTLLRVVSKATSVYYNINLPVSPIIEK